MVMILDAFIVPSLLTLDPCPPLAAGFSGLYEQMCATSAARLHRSSLSPFGTAAVSRERLLRALPGRDEPLSSRSRPPNQTQHTLPTMSSRGPGKNAGESYCHVIPPRTRRGDAPTKLARRGGRSTSVGDSLWRVESRSHRVGR